MTTVCYIQTEGGTQTGKAFSRLMVTCDICQAKNLDTFIDGNTKLGSWANMCPVCHKKYGFGLGTGVGQKYQTELSLVKSGPKGYDKHNF